MDRGAWQTTVQGVAKNWAQRSNDNSGLRCGAYFCMIFTICKCSLAGCPDLYSFSMGFFKRSLSILSPSPLSDINFANTSLPVCGLSFDFLNKAF